MEELRHTLRDGLDILVREIRPEDKQALQDGMRKLSTESRRLRFLTVPNHLTDQELEYLTEVDQHDHIAVVVGRADDPTQGIAVARSIRSPDNPQVAEPAITVLDAYQNRGLGTYLLGLLSREAYAHGVRHFRALVSSSNVPMIEILERLGAERVRAESGSTWYDIPLHPDPHTTRPALRALLGEAARRT